MWCGQLSLVWHRKRVKISAWWVFRVVEHIFNETAMQAKKWTINCLANAMKASRGARGSFQSRQRKESRKQKKNAKSKGPKGSQGWNIENWFNRSGKTRNHGQARKLRNLQKDKCHWQLVIRDGKKSSQMEFGWMTRKVGKQTYGNSASSCSPAWSRTCGVCTTQRCVTEEHEKRSACSCLCYQLSRFLQSYVRQLVTFASDKLFDMNRVFCIARIVSAAHNMILFFLRTSLLSSYLLLLVKNWPEYNKKGHRLKRGNHAPKFTICTMNH